jgi:integrase
LSKISRDLMQRYMDTMRSDGNSPATMALERSMFRVLFNYAFRTWKWTELLDNPATGLKMPAVENVRKRVMSQDEQSLLDEALTTCRSKLVAPMRTLLRETAMRSSEPLQHATWADVDWERKVLALPDSKSGCRDVPLSPVALQVLRDLGPGEPNETIIKITYESLRAAWTRACERAGIKNLKIHDNRRTAATRMALKTGNAFLVQALTGHKNWSMVERYVNVGADDVVKVMHAPEPTAAPVTLAVEVGAPASVQVVQAVPVSSVCAPAVYTLEQMQELVQMTVKTTLAGLAQRTDSQNLLGAGQLVASQQGFTETSLH